MKTPLNKKTLQQHFHYSWFLYALSAILCFFFWNMYYTMSAPRTPDDKKLELYIYAYGESSYADEYFARVQAEDLPDMQEITAQYMMPDESSGPMVLSTRVMAGEGDLYLLPRDNFQSYAAQGLFVALDELEGITEMCAEAGINVERGWRKNQDNGERHLYGLPVSGMTGMAGGISEWTYATSEMYLSVRLYNGNDENAEKLLRIILRDCLPKGGSEDSAATDPEPATLQEQPELTSEPPTNV